MVIYGWHQTGQKPGTFGVPIQGEVDWHDITFADYSHGVRLVSQKMVVDDKEADLFDVLKGIDAKGDPDKTLMALLVKNTSDPLLPIPKRYPGT